MLSRRQLIDQSAALATAVAAWPVTERPTLAQAGWGQGSVAHPADRERPAAPGEGFLTEVPGAHHLSSMSAPAGRPAR
jgi:hypothetical protein